MRMVIAPTEQALLNSDYTSTEILLIIQLRYLHMQIPTIALVPSCQSIHVDLFPRVLNHRPRRTTKIILFLLFL